MRILGFLDQGAQEGMILNELPVYHPESSDIPADWKLGSRVLIAIYNDLDSQNRIKESLNRQGFTNVGSGYDIAICFSSANDPATRLETSDFFSANRDTILLGCDIWQDERSTYTYLSHFRGYAQSDLGAFLCETDHKQYFAPLLEKGKGFQRFIDCGSFDGDTLVELNETVGKVEALALFEPCENNLKKLGSYIRSQGDSLAEQIFLFPCGVWQQTCQLHFDASAGSASTLAAQGHSLIQCVAIDEALQGFRPTFIKMDIEGAEHQALQGGEQTIRTHKPDLAISVYHELSHFWEIPQLLKAWVPEYQFYLRTYAAAGFESVLYAIAPE